jgi:predicted bacteriocin transport accessory protein
MKNSITKLLALFVLVTLSMTSVYAAGKFTGGSQHEFPEWFKASFLDMAEDVEEAKEEDKHVILFMSLDFCPYCTKMLKDNFVVGAKNQEYIQEHFDVIGINIKGSKEIAINEDLTLTEREYAKHLKVQYTPTVLFLNQDNEVVVRINGYRSAHNFKYILDYVKNKEYNNMTLTAYLDKVNNKTLYTLKPNDMFKDIKDLSKIDGPLAVIFEDGSCTQCDYLHNNTLKNKDVIHELSQVTVVRYDATSEEKIVTPDGKITTPKQWAKDMLLDYRPGIVMFNKKKEIVRIDALLYSFHFKELVRYVSGEFYETYHTFLDYLGPRQQDLLNDGVNIDISSK